MREVVTGGGDLHHGGPISRASVYCAVPHKNKRQQYTDAASCSFHSVPRHLFFPFIKISCLARCNHYSRNCRASSSKLETTASVATHELFPERPARSGLDLSSDSRA
ncbi:hypothetical protein BDL97_08G033600 [Sphagnum fallax]|nr:hypothetical protein BDL97_08G033600 [Sphagnum fallax]